MRDPRIQAAVAAVSKAIFPTDHITEGWIVDQLLDKATNAFDEKIQVKSLELLGKYRRLFTDKIEIDDGKDHAERMADAEARANGD